MNDYLPKPINRAELLSKIDYWAEWRRNEPDPAGTAPDRAVETGKTAARKKRGSGARKTKRQRGTV